MSNWIKQRADDIRRIDKEKKEEFDRKAVAASELKAQLKPLWKELCDVLNQSVQDFNSEFSEASRRIDLFERSDASTLTIRRNLYPSVTIKVQLNSAGTTVQYLISRTLRKGNNPIETPGTFAYAVNDGVASYAESNLRTPEDVAKVLLDAFFEF